MAQQAKIITWDIIILFAIGIVCIASLLMLNGVFIAFIENLGWSPDGVQVDLSGARQYLTAIVMVGIFPAVLEEIIFRGFLLWLFLRMGKFWAILLTSVLFSAFHLNWSQTLYQFILGLILAYVVVRTGKLWYAIILHFINNFLVITYTYIATVNSHEISLQLNYFELTPTTLFSTFFLALIGGIAIISLLRLLNEKETINATD